MTATEYVILVDSQDNEIGFAEKLYAHANNLLHRAFSIFIFHHTPQLELLIQQRALSKYHSPGLWTNTCCSHPRAKENILAAGQRRLQEELNISSELINIGWFHYNAHFENGLSENEVDHVLIGYLPAGSIIIPNSNEVHAYRWITLTDLEYEIARHPHHYTQWLKQALAVVQMAFNTTLQHHSPFMS